MPQLARLYDLHAEDCIRTAEKIDNPSHRAMLLKAAAEWRQAAQARRQSLQHSEEQSSGEKLAQHLASHVKKVGHGERGISALSHLR
jgi:phosphoribosyl 1,2-cyclic phosphodiesterase